MNVRDLIDALRLLDADRLVVLQKDSEGNGYSPLSGIWQGSYLAESTWSGEAGLERLTDQDRDRGYDEEDVIDGVPAVMLQPVN